MKYEESHLKLMLRFFLAQHTRLSTPTLYGCFNKYRVAVEVETAVMNIY
jgi:hypothetical protein